MSVLEKFEDGTRQRASDNTATNNEASMNQKHREFTIHDIFVLDTLNKNYLWFLYLYFVFLSPTPSGLLIRVGDRDFWSSLKQFRDREGVLSRKVKM